MNEKVATLQRHPKNKSLSEAVQEDAPKFKAVSKNGINKRSTLIKAPGDEGQVGGIMEPTAEQLEKINQFTRRTVSAEEVCVLPTLSCNDLVDRDYDQFVKQCVKDFAAMEQPFSPVGKSFMVDHAYSVANAVGRIFDVGTKTINNAFFLTNDVYIPNTEKNSDFLEDVEFGVNWAVSVGVVLGKSECSVCGERFSSWGYWCINGHDKGLHYTKDAEEDSFGWPIPCEPSEKGAILCVRQFSDPRDFYELSQVFLGAQYYAALERDPEMDGILKAASAEGIPVIGLSEEQAKEIPFRHEPPKVTEARLAGLVSETEDGLVKWTDEQGFLWVYNPQEPEEGVMSLGRSSEHEDEDVENDKEASDGSEELDEHASGNDAAGDEQHAQPDSSGRKQHRSEDPGSEVGSVQPGSSGTLTASADEDDSEEEESDPDEVAGDGDESEDGGEEDEAEEDSESETVDAVAAARRAGLPSELISSVVGSGTATVESLFSAASAEIKALRKTITNLEAKGEIADKYVEELRADALSWYIKSRQAGEQRPVKTETFEKLLDRCGDDVELIKALRDEQKEAAHAKFPKSVRRSTFPGDPHEVERPRLFGADDRTEEEEVSETVDSAGDTKVRRIHG